MDTLILIALILGLFISGVLWLREIKKQARREALFIVRTLWGFDPENPHERMRYFGKKGKRK